MQSGRSRTEAALCAVLACAAVVFLSLPVVAATGMPPDTEQLLGVGAKADGMGNAFVAIANDPTAAFWNPAGLSFLQKTELMAVVKSVPSVSQTTYMEPGDSGGWSGFDSVTRIDSMSSGATTGETAFLGVTAKIGNDPLKGGTLAISRTLAGYLDRQWSLTQDFNAIDPGEVTSMSTDVHDRLRVDYNTVSYGWRYSPTWNVGVGLVQAVAEASISGTSETWFMDDPEPFEDVIGPESTTGKGYGGVLGLLWSPLVPGDGKLTVGASYMSKISMSGLDSSGFGNERPDRLLLGANYRQLVPAGEMDNEVQWSVQLSRSGDANADEGGMLARNAVWNFYFGGEYDIHRPKLDYLVRYGLFTNKSPNKTVYGNETWLTLGFGTGRPGSDWKADLALQQGLRSGISLLSFSGGYSF